MGKKVVNIMKPEEDYGIHKVGFFFLTIIYDPLANDPVLSWQK